MALTSSVEQSRQLRSHSPGLVMHIVGLLQGGLDHGQSTFTPETFGEAIFCYLQA